MQVPADEIVDVIAVGKRFVPAALAMTVGLIMIGAGVTRGARRGIRASGGQHMLVDVVAMDAVQVPVVDVIGVALVLDERSQGASRSRPHPCGELWAHSSPISR